jgi:hypothetical protein
MRNAEGKTVSYAGGARVAGAPIGTTDGGTQHTPLQAPGATVGEAAGEEHEGPTPSTTVQDPGPRLDWLTCVAGGGGNFD